MRNFHLTTNNTLIGLFFIALGLLFCVYQSSILNIALTVIGSGIIILGIFDLFSKRINVSLMKIGIGTFIIIASWLILDITLIIIGILAIIYSVLRLFLTIYHCKILDKGNFGWNIIVSLIVLTIGILLIVARWQITDVFIIAVGAISIFYGVIKCFCTIN